MNRKKRMVLAVLLMLCIVATSIPNMELLASTETLGTKVLDFNGMDFDTTINHVEAGYLNNTVYDATLVTDTSSVPEGFADCVYEGGNNDGYAATAVGFWKPLDLSKVTSIRLRMYVPKNEQSSSQSLRIFDTGENDYKQITPTTFGAWYEVELLDVLNTDTITKNADGYLERFAIGYRTRVAIPVYFDCITIEYSEEGYFVGDDVQEGGVKVLDFNGTDFGTTLNGGGSIGKESAASLVMDTTNVPEGFEDCVYAGGNANYAGTAVEFDKPLDLSKVTSIKVRIYIPTYTSSSAPALRVIDTSESTDIGYQTLDTPTFGQWCEIEMLSALNNSAITKNADGYLKRFVIGYRPRGTVTVYFDSIIIEYSEEGYFVGDDAQEGGVKVLDFNGIDFDTVVNLDGSYVTQEASVTSLLSDTSTVPTGFTDSVYAGGNGSYAATAVGFKNPLDLSKVTSVKVRMYVPTYTCETSKTPALRIMNTAEKAFVAATAPTMDTWCEIELIDILTSSTITKNDNDYLERFVIGYRTYAAGECIVYFDSIIIEYSEEGYFVEDGSQEENNSYDDVTITRLASASKVNGGTWQIYPVPTSAASVPGTEWETKFLNVVYEVDGKSYTTDFMRAHDNEGLYMTIPGTNLDPSAAGSTVIIKAGQYKSNGGSNGISITEDFTFYVINGALTTEFDFDNPDFTSDVYCNADSGVYTVTDAETVYIDGVAYAKGDTYAVSGTHTLTYQMYDREYSRKLVIYRSGDLDDNGKANAVDLIRMKKYLDVENSLELTESSVKGADLNRDNEVNDADTKLIRKYLVLDGDVLILGPETGVTVAMPSEAVTALTTDYDYTKGKTAELKTGEDLYQRESVEIYWLSKVNVTEYQILLAQKSDFSDAVQYQTTATSLSLDNLLPATTYYWKLVAGDVETDVRMFQTADTIRTLTIDGVSNVRDSGGYATTDDNTVKYGMIYRGGKLNDITEEGKYQMLSVLGVKTDLDLRTPGEGGAGEASPLGDSVFYYNYDAPYYWAKIIDTSYKEGTYQKALADEIRVFAKEENYPIYVHCSIGRDRTGTILLLINGLLGVKKADLYLDYELSFLSAVGGSDSANVSEMLGYFGETYDEIQKYAPNGTFADACEAFMLEYCGIEQAEIDAIRNILLSKK